MTKSFKPIFTIANRIAAGLTRIERGWENEIVAASGQPGTACSLITR